MPNNFHHTNTATQIGTGRPLPLRQKRLFWKTAGGVFVIFMLYRAGPLLWLGYPTFSIISGATWCQVFKIDPERSEPEGPLSARTDHHAILATGKKLTGTDIAQIQRILLNPARYAVGPLDPAACHLSPGVAFRLWRGSDSVDVLACYQCAHVIIATHDAGGRLVHQYMTPFPVGELSGFVRQAFPNDPELQGVLADFEVKASRRPKR